MLAGLTPTCSSTSATDRRRLILASRRWWLRLGLRGKYVILSYLGREHRGVQNECTSSLIRNPRCPLMMHKAFSNGPSAGKRMHHVEADHRRDDNPQTENQ